MQKQINSNKFLDLILKGSCIYTYQKLGISVLVTRCDGDFPSGEVISTHVAHILKVKVGIKEIIKDVL